ncbi:Golgi integral membrane protein 4 [Holothuria leucospilota]|uniref:Golgi integral membrane protein 4 n=1 Tax=Holothuria leucospilota TaxID=206669 RepID=A0A9Q1BE60_HOLLE|nr:Golgi integral membrane protein 4 [Holothuria leucospilota]
MMLTSRRNRTCGQSVFVALVLLTMVYGGYLYYDLKKSLDDTRDRALRYQQQQESLTGQLQVVYEHRLRLEKALQEAKGESKRIKEESQRKLEVDQQEANNRYNALNIQHKMLKSQHDDLKDELDSIKQQHRQTVDEMDKLKYEYRLNISNLKEDFGLRQNTLKAEMSALQAEVEQGQLMAADLRQTKHTVEQLSQDKKFLSDRLMEKEQQFSNQENEKMFLQSQVESLNQQLQLLRKQLEEARNNQVQPQPGGIQKMMDPYEQQKVAFDQQRQQELIEQRYVQQPNIIPQVNQINIAGRGAGQPIVMHQQPQQQPNLLPQIQQVIQQQPQQQQQQQQHQQQQPVQDVVAGNVNQQQQLPNDNIQKVEGGQDNDGNPNLHLPKQLSNEEKEKNEDSDYEADSESQVDVDQQGVVLQDPAKVALQAQGREKEKHENDVDNLADKAAVKSEERDDPKVGKNKDVEEDEDHRLRREAGENAAEQGPSNEEDENQNEDERMQAVQENHLDQVERQGDDFKDVGLAAPNDYRGDDQQFQRREEEDEGDEDEEAPPGLVVNVQRDEIEEQIEEQEDRRKQQQLQLQARAQQAHEVDKDEDSNLDKEDGPSDSDDEQDGDLQRKVVQFDAAAADNVPDNPDIGEDGGVMQRPDFNDAQQNNIVNNPPVLDLPVKRDSEENVVKQKEENEEMR